MVNNTNLARVNQQANATLQNPEDSPSLKESLKTLQTKEGYAKFKINCSYDCENRTGNTPTSRLQSEKTVLSPLGTNVHVQAIILCRAHINSALLQKGK